MDPLFDASFLRKLELLTISARRAFRGQMRGEQRSTRHGSSVEFADYRQYSPGDDFRRIDWNAFARFDNLFLKLFREEEDLHLYLLCDASASMNFGQPNKFDYARRVCAALAYVALNNADRASVHLLGQADGAAMPVAGSIGPRRGKGATIEMFRFLEQARPAGRTNLSAAVRYVLAQRARPGIAVICSDLLLHEGYEDAIRRLAYEKFQPMLVHVMSPQEIEPDVQGDLRLVDSETGGHVELSTTKRVLATYRARFEAFRASVTQFARTHAVDYVFTSTATPFEDLVLRWMRAANMLA